MHKSFFKKINFFKIKNKLGKDPDLDWNIILVVFTILSISLIAYSGFLFVEVIRGEDKVSTNNVERAKLNEKGLNDVVIKYENKKVEFDSRLKRVEPFADPSL